MKRGWGEVVRRHCLATFFVVKERGADDGVLHGVTERIITDEPGERSFGGVRLEGAEGSEIARVENARCPLKSVSPPSAVMEV